MEKQKELPRFPHTTKAEGEEKEKEKSESLVLQSPLSRPTSPVKVVHFSNAVADDTKAILEDSISFLTTAKLENYKLGPEHKSQLIFH